MSIPLLPAARAALARRGSEDSQGSSLLNWAKLAQPGYQAGRVHKLLAAVLEVFAADILAQQSPRLAVVMPPRHGKSRLGVEMFIPWFLSQARRAIHAAEVQVVSYAQGVARKRTREARELLAGDAGRLAFDLELSRDTAAKSDWMLAAACGGGSVWGAGATGSLTGLGAHLLAYDDPTKGIEQAMSKAWRNRIWDGYRANAYTRLAPGAGILGIWTRWHEDDLHGRIMDSEEGCDWQVVHLPAVATHDEPHRRAGEALHPERWPLQRLERIRRALGEYLWQCLYQGNPAGEPGQVFAEDDWGVYDPDATCFDEVVLSGDLTFGAKSTDASWVSWQAWGAQAGKAHLTDEARGRWTYPEARAALEGMAQAHAPKRILIEAAAHGWALAQEIAADKEMLRRLGSPKVELINPVGSKLARAMAWAPRVRQGKALIPDPRRYPWVSAWLREVCGFPGGKHDDRIDSAGMAVRKITDARRSSSAYFGVV